MKLVQLKNKNNENINPRNLNYEKRLEKLEGYILYDNENGTNSNITLSDDLTHYKYVDIFYKSNMGVFNTTRVYNPNDRTAHLMVDAEKLLTHIILLNAWITLANNTITWIKYNGAVLSENNISITTDSSYYNLKITKVVGYK